MSTCLLIHTALILVLTLVFMMYEVKDFLKQKLIPTTTLAVFGVIYLLIGIFAVDYLAGLLELEIETKWTVLSSAIVSAASLLTLRREY